jgi:hypothetical protein
LSNINVWNIGNQPEDGKMTYIVTKHRLPGFKSNSSGTIRIDYYFPDGTQDVSFY